MRSPLVSVIIPAYNQADSLGEAIQSVLDQTYSAFEVIVVNDASRDHTAEVVKQFNDPRLRCIVHEQNRGLPAARNTGMRASSGEIIALLDADDIFHPEKLQAHVTFLEKHPEVGVTYNARFDLNHSSKTIRDLYRPPAVVSLSDFVFGFPFTPSDMVIRREWAFKVDLFDERYVCGGEDLDFPCRLALEGCQFVRVDRALNYRRFHSARPRKNLAGRWNDYARALNTAFSHPCCPIEVLALRDKAWSRHSMVLAYIALAQGETNLGQEFLREAVQLNPAIIAGEPCEFVSLVVRHSIWDESQNYEVILQRVFNQLPQEMTRLLKQYDWATAHGYLLRCMRAVMWGRFEDGRKHLARAIDLGVKIEESFLRELAHKLLDYEAELGLEPAQEVLQNLVPYLEKIGKRSSVRWLKGCVSVNRAFQNYRNGEYMRVPGEVMRALTHDPQYLANRGVLSIVFRSIMAIASRQTTKSILLSFKGT